MKRSWHLDAAHALWQKILHENDTAIDATAGNGHDTLILSRIIKTGKLYAIDIQQEALKKTKEKIEQANPGYDQIVYINASHAHFPSSIPLHSVRLIVYNLGYLPGGDKSLTTETQSTLESLENALDLLMPSGAISLMLYPGHEEGEREAKAVIAFAKDLSKIKYEVTHHTHPDNPKSPSLLWIKSL